MGLRTSARTRGRRLVDRVVRPYLDELRDGSFRPAAGGDPIAGPVDEAVAAGNVPSDFFHNLLHELRTLELQRVAHAGGNVLSVGASGTWYFDWFERSYGLVEQHIGIEAFEPMPEDLPSSVRWIAAPADRFDGVQDGSVDLVFAGQTTELLWANELVGFLLESHRVLRPGGMLSLDSPNRLVTEHLQWSHGGHTIELSAGEMAELLRLAGFAPMPARGAWMCKVGDEVLALEDRLDDAALLARRIALAGEDPDAAFVWWINAVRTDAEPDAEALRSAVDARFAEHWPLRISRGAGRPGADTAAIGPEDALRTLPFPVPAGRWQLCIRQIRPSQPEAGPQLAAEIVGPGGEVLHEMSTDSAVVDGNLLQWSFEQPTLVFACSLVLRQIDPTAEPVTVSYPFDLRPDGGRFHFDVSA